jgi:hypothetical protein
MLDLSLNDTVMELIELLETALHAAAVVFLTIVVVHASCIIMREIEYWDPSNPLHLSISIAANLIVISTVKDVVSVFDGNVVEISIISIYAFHLLSSSLGVQVLHRERV